jgi:hypothetical protein
MVIYKIFVFGADRKSNMAARAHNAFWLVEILKIFLLETTEHIMGPGSHVGFPISAKNINLVYDHPMNISAKFDSNLFCGPVLNLWIVCQSEIQDGGHDST